MLSSMTVDAEEKILENRIRRMAKRQGLALRKSRRRDPYASDFGVYWLAEERGDGLIFPNAERAAAGLGATLDDVERFLSKNREDQARHITAALAYNRANETLFDLRLKGIEDGDQWDATSRALQEAKAAMHYFEKITRTSYHAPNQFNVDARCGHRHPTKADAERCREPGDSILESSFAWGDVAAHFVLRTVKP